MSFTVDTAFVHNFSENVHTLAQQMESKLRGAVRIRSGVKGKTHNFERVSSVTMVALTSRHQDTPLTEVTHSRRRASLTDYALAELIDDVDEVRMLISPQSDYARMFAASYNRRLDATIIAALNASAVSVDSADATSSVALGSGQQVANNNQGGQLRKLLNAKRLLDAADVPKEDRVFIHSPRFLEDLFNETAPNVTSADYNSVKALVRGEVDTFLGFTWVSSTLLPLSGTARSNFAFQKDGMACAIGRDLSIEIDKRADKNNSTQVLTKVAIGAVRVEEVRVVEILASEP